MRRWAGNVLSKGVVVSGKEAALKNVCYYHLLNGLGLRNLKENRQRTFHVGRKTFLYQCAFCTYIKELNA